ncbi:hypothetical protein D3C72_1303310 [compost metagenome]
MRYGLMEQTAKAPMVKNRCMILIDGMPLSVNYNLQQRSPLWGLTYVGWVLKQATAEKQNGVYFQLITLTRLKYQQTHKKKSALSPPAI